MEEALLSEQRKHMSNGLNLFSTEISEELRQIRETESLWKATK
jgi:hypothetical protein